MESLVSLPFKLLEIPNLKLKKPSWFKQPTAMQMFAFILVSYFMVTGGRRLFNVGANFASCYIGTYLPT